MNRQGDDRGIITADQASFNLATEKVSDNLTRTYVSVRSNVEGVVMVDLEGTFNLDSLFLARYFS